MSDCLIPAKPLVNVTKLLIPGQTRKILTEGRCVLLLALLGFGMCPTYFLHQPRQLLQVADCCMPDSLTPEELLCYLCYAAL